MLTVQCITYVKPCKLKTVLRCSWNGIAVQVFIVIILNIGSQVAPADGLITLPLTILKASTGRTLPAIFGIPFVMLMLGITLVLRSAVRPVCILLQTLQHRMSSILAWSSVFPYTAVLCILVKQ